MNATHRLPQRTEAGSSRSAVAWRSSLERLESDLEGTDLVVARTHPRPGRLHLDLRNPGGDRVIGQWFADVQDADAAVAEVPSHVAKGLERLGESVVLHRDGADGRLRPLASLVAGGAQVVVHRPERRAVLRDGEAYLKVVRPRRVVALADAMRLAADIPGVRAPEVGSVDPAGVVRMSTLPGKSLHEHLHDHRHEDLPARALPGTSRAADLPGLAAAAGESIRRLHAGASQPAAQSLKEHDHAAEVAATSAIIEAAAEHRVLDQQALDRLRGDVAAVGARLARHPLPAGPALLHRDLHDKQLMVAGEAVGLLDVDGMAIGDPALDLGNLTAHLRFRVRQGWVADGLAASVSEGILQAYRPDARTESAMELYAALTDLRLEALYAFRPADRPPVGG